MAYAAEHPSDWTLEQLAEDELPPVQRAAVEEHVEACPRCAAEVDGYRALFLALSGMPRFEPSPGFGEAVMARVRIVPLRDPVFARFIRWLPSTRRGWILLVLASLVPALPIIGLAAWLLAQPLVAPDAAVAWGAAWLREGGWSLLIRGLEIILASGAFAWGQALLERLLAAPVEVLAAGALILALGIPLSAWTLYRQLRTPVRGTTYAH